MGSKKTAAQLLCAAPIARLSRGSPPPSVFLIAVPANVSG
jgi:hypothetical protein